MAETFTIRLMRRDRAWQGKCLHTLGATLGQLPTGGVGTIQPHVHKYHEHYPDRLFAMTGSGSGVVLIPTLNSADKGGEFSLVG